MADFRKSIEIIFEHEGGYQRNKHDRGNYNSRKELVGTNWGIAAFVAESFLGRAPSIRDMRTMTKTMAMTIYHTKFWRRIQGDKIKSQRIANIFMDGHVNHGKTGIRMMQEVLGLKRDGIVGRRTIAAINARNPEKLYQAYRTKRILFYAYLAQHRKGQIVFLRGWLIRICSFTEY